MKEEMGNMKKKNNQFEEKNKKMENKIQVRTAILIIRFVCVSVIIFLVGDIIIIKLNLPEESRAIFGAICIIWIIWNWFLIQKIKEEAKKVKK